MNKPFNVSSIQWISDYEFPSQDAEVQMFKEPLPLVPTG